MSLECVLCGDIFHNTNTLCKATDQKNRHNKHLKNFNMNSSMKVFCTANPPHLASCVPEIFFGPNIIFALQLFHFAVFGQKITIDRSCRNTFLKGVSTCHLLNCYFIMFIR